MTEIEPVEAERSEIERFEVAVDVMRWTRMEMIETFLSA